MILYDFELDENCYKIRLLLAMSGLSYDKVAVDMYPGREERQPALLALNPLGRLPILVDGEAVLHGAEAILLYLATRYEPARCWLPEDAVAFGQVAMWLQFAAVPLGAAVTARQVSLFSMSEELRTDPVRQVFRIMEDHMIFRGFDAFAWFVGGQPSLADIALFPSVALSRDFGVEHESYPALRKWMRRMRSLPGFVTMPGVPDYY